MASVSGALRRIKSDLKLHLRETEIEKVCQEAKYTWRERLLGPVRTIHLFVLQILWSNTAIRHLRHLAGEAINAGAYCKARMRLPLAVLQLLLRQSADAMLAAARASAEKSAEWTGMRAFLVDGSSTITPDTPALRKHFGQPKGCKKGCGFPVPKLLGLIDAFSGLVLEMICGPLYTHDLRQVWRVHALLRAGDLLIGDRGLCSYVHLALLQAAGVMGLFRMHQMQVVDFRPHRKCKAQLGGCNSKKAKGKPTSRFLRRLGKHDQVVEWQKPRQCPKWMNQKQFDALPATMEVREIRYHLANKGQRTLCVTIATTLLDPVKYPKEKIQELYGIRWRVETHFAELKTTLGMRKLKCKTVEGVKKELAVYCLVYNLVHAVMMKAAERQGVEWHRISFIDAVRWLLTSDPRDEMPDLVVNPQRPGRHEPRVVKDREDTYTKMTRPRAELRKALKKQAKKLK